MRRLIERIISKLRGFEYHIDRDITTSQLFLCVLSRCFMTIRGFFVKIRLKQSSGLLFIGRHVKIKNAQKMVLGRNSTIHDNCFIDAMCREGVIIGNLFVLGRNSTIECTGVISDLGESLQIGDNVGISQGAFISVRGKVEIGSDTIIGPNVTIISENHNMGDANTPIRLQGVSRMGIRIGSNCWFGAGVTILDGVTIGNGAVIAAGAVVTKDVNDNEIVAGIPARVIRRR